MGKGGQMYGNETFGGEYTKYSIVYTDIKL